MASFKQIYRVPAKTLRAWNGTTHTVNQATTEINFNAQHERQAFIIAQQIGKKNGWSMSGNPKKKPTY